MKKNRKNCIFNLLIALLIWAPGLGLASKIVCAVKPSTPTVTIRLPANPSTGYQWVLINYDRSLMAPPTSRFVSGRDLPGAPGYAVWQFKFHKTAFTASQKTVVILEYKRPWEKLAGKKQIITINIQTQ